MLFFLNVVIPSVQYLNCFHRLLAAHQFRIEEPQNKLSVVGSTVTWKCLPPSRNASRIEWLKYSAGNLMPLFNDRMGIYSAYRDRYSVDSSSGYALVIRNVQLTDAGRFICSIQTSARIIERTAYLQIFGNNILSYFQRQRFKNINNCSETCLCYCIGTHGYNSVIGRF